MNNKPDTPNPTCARLRTENPEHILYNYEMIRIAILGGIRTDILDRMKVTLKVQVEHLSIRHTIDLYNHNQTEKFTRMIAEKLEVGASVTAAALDDLTDCLEAYRLEQREQQIQAREDKTRKLLSPEETKEARHEWKAPNLIGRISGYLQQTGIIGEETNALILWFVMTSRKLPDPLSAISLAGTGTGKSYLQERVAMCMPEEDLIESTQFTESSFYRFDRYQLRGKVFLIEDLDGAENVLYPIREMQSKKRISKTVAIKDNQGKHKTVTLVVEGPVSVCGCTTRESIYEDNANRSLLLHLDGSREQDKRIMAYHKKVKAGLIDTTTEEQIREKLKNMQRALQPVKVVNPYSLHIELPEEVMNPRRTLPLLLGFIESVTFSHQYQREPKVDTQTGEEFIETEPEDIEIAFKLLRDVLFRKSDELSGACRKFYDWLQSWAKGKGVTKFFARDIREDKRIHPRTLTRYLEELRMFGRLEITGGRKQRVGYEYGLATWKNDERLQDRIDEWIEATVKEITIAHQKRTNTAKKKGGKAA